MHYWFHIKTSTRGEKFKEQLVTIISVSPSSMGAVNSTDWVFFILHHVVCVCVCLECICVNVCVSIFFISSHTVSHSVTSHPPLRPSLEVVDEHRNAVGSHQVVGVSGERLVLPAFWVTCRQTDGRGGGE